MPYDVKEIRSRDNAVIKRVYQLTHDKDLRESEGVFVCEGMKMLIEAIGSDVRIESIFAQEDLYDHIASLEAEDRYSVKPHVLEKISSVKTPQGVVFTCYKNPPRDVFHNHTIALDGIKDPGNLGTIIRCADAFSFSGIVLLGECVDVFSPKVVRSTMGSIFRVPIIKMELDELRREADKRGLRLTVASRTDKAADIRAVDLKERLCIIGSEAHGVSEQALAVSPDHVVIPMGSADSLNAAVAASLIMWETVRGEEKAR